MDIILNRIAQDDKTTIGQLIYSRGSLFTIELPWVGNVQKASCIPAGKYLIKPELHPKFGKCIRLFEVPERDGILIHVGNTTSDTTGCILLGVGYDFIKEALSGSKRSINSLYDYLNPVKEEHYLRINETFGDVSI
jgi:hypothetical protein